MFERPIVFRDRTDTQGGDAGFRAQLGHDLFGGAEAARLRHVASLRKLNERYAFCYRVVLMVGHYFARPVLVVDDDDATRAAERAVLVENGFRVIEARDGEEAMLAINNDPPAVVVLDIQMPGIDGPSFARDLRMTLRHVPLVVLTGADDPKHEADRCNAEAFLSKPFDAPELLKVVRRFAG